MKLYTEEELIHICLYIGDYHNYNEEDVKEVMERLYLTPIELPSDEEMANASNHCKDGQVKVGFLRGVLWYQEQILNQNK